MVNRLIHVGLCVLLAPSTANAVTGEWQLSLVGALELPALASQSPTDFDLATFSTGGQLTYGLFDWLHLGGRLMYSQVDGVVEGYSTTTEAETTFTGRLFVGLSAWRTEAVLVFRLLDGFAVEPRLTLGGGYTWTIYTDPVLRLDDGDITVTQTDAFAQGTLTGTASLDLAWRFMPSLEISAGVEVSQFVDGLYSSALRFPIGVRGVFWGPL